MPNRLVRTTLFADLTASDDATGASAGGSVAGRGSGRRIETRSARALLVAVGLFATGGLLSACGAGSVSPADGGQSPGAELVVLDPPGESIGLTFGASVTLRVRYQRDAAAGAAPIRGAAVEFAILESNTGNPGGSTLSATSAFTSGDGVAELELTAGAARANFRVEVSATGATPAFFYISVSEAGFTELLVTPEHVGWRASESFEKVELRLYQESAVRCAELDIDAAPISVFPPRTLAGFGESVTYRNVAVGQSYTLVGWALKPESDTPLAGGCIDLTSELVDASNVQLELAVTDRQPALPAAVALRSAVDLQPLVDYGAQQNPNDPWRTLACANGPGQLLLDCTLDALVPDGLLDCVVNASMTASPLLTAVEAARGPAADDSCRPGSVAAADTLDKELTDAVGMGDFPTGSTLTDLVDGLSDVAGPLTITSDLRFNGSSAADHQLISAALRIDGTDWVVDLGATPRPVVQQGPIGINLTTQTSLNLLTSTLDISTHSFTLRPGSIARTAFREIALVAAGLDERELDLGHALAESTRDTENSTAACAALSSILCARVASELTCAELACEAAATYLDDAIQRWWRQLDGVDLDFSLSGTTEIRDTDDDLLYETFGNDASAPIPPRTPPPIPGSWTVVFTPRDGADVSSTGSFASSAAPQ